MTHYDEQLVKRYDITLLKRCSNVILVNLGQMFYFGK